MTTSTTVDTNHSSTPFSFSYGDSQKILNISEPLLNTETLARLRAISEFIKQGMKKQTVTFTMFFVDLHINDILKLSVPERRIPRELNKDRFIVKKVTHNITSNSITTTLEVERYD